MGTHSGLSATTVTDSSIIGTAWRSGQFDRALAHRWYAAYLRLMGRHDQPSPKSPAPGSSIRSHQESTRPSVRAVVRSSIRPGDRSLEENHRVGPELSLRASLPRPHLCGTGQVRGGRCRIHAGDGARSRYACHSRLSGRGVHAHAGDRARALAVLQRLPSSKEHVSGGELAILLSALGERERAFASLEDAYRAHDMQLSIWEWSRRSTRCARTAASRT